MAVDLLALKNDLPMPPALRIECVSDFEALRRWLYVFTLGFGLPESVANAMFEIEVDLGQGQHLPRRLYVGWWDGEPVATSLLFLGAGVAGIYGVVTLPEARRQGIGRAMTLLPLLEARAAGYRVGILHASQMGLRLYRRLGFQQYCELSSYTWIGE
jgi:GNAT superfamily N-acetyltransferase